MKIKKYFFLFCISGTVLLTGCVDTMELSEEDTQVVVDYMASSVIKYDSSNDYRLVKLQLDEEEDVKENIEDVKSETNTEKQNLNDEDKQIKTEDNNEKDGPKDTISIADVMGISEADIKIKSCDEIERYSEDSSYIIEPTNGKKLVKIILTISNNTNKKIKICTINNKSLSYRFFVNKMSFLPLMTAADNDIMFLDTAINAGEKIDAVIFYQIDKNIEISSASLEISSDIGSSNILIK